MAMEKEKRVFEAFFKSCGDFASEEIKHWYVLDDWYKIAGNARPAAPHDNRPDVIGITNSNKRIGVELKAWLNEEQIHHAKQQEMFQDAILKALNDLPINDNKCIERVWLRAKPKRFVEADAVQLRNEVFELIRQNDAVWSKKEKWEQSSREMISDLSGFPVVEKYIDFVELFPRREPIEPKDALQQEYPAKRWISFPSRGGAYTLDEMLTPLAERLLKTRSDERYKDICKQVGLHECYLLVHYDFDAFAYNTPIDVLDYSFANVADFARTILAGDSGFFQRIFLLNCLEGNEESHRLV